MSYLLLSSGLDEERVSRQANFLWNIFGGGGVSNTATYKWNILTILSATAIQYKWNIFQTNFGKSAYYKWSIFNYESRQISYIWEIATSFGYRIKYTFIKNRVTNRFFKRDRLG